MYMIPGLLFVVASIIDIVATSIGNQELHVIAKPCLMPLLLLSALLYFRENVTVKVRPIPLLLTFALLFHTGGDVFLLGSGSTFFLLGLASFLIGHFFYIAIVCKGLKNLTLPEALIGCGLPLILGAFIAAIFKLDWPMNAAVTVYAITLVTYPCLGIVGLMQKKREYRYFIWGGLLFIISDSILALNEFMGIDFPLRGGLVMLTYILAEVLLVMGVVRVVPKQK